MITCQMSRGVFFELNKGEIVGLLAYKGAVRSVCIDLDVIRIIVSWACPLSRSLVVLRLMSPGTQKLSLNSEPCLHLITINKHRVTCQLGAGPCLASPPPAVSPPHPRILTER